MIKFSYEQRKKRQDNLQAVRTAARLSNTAERQRTYTPRPPCKTGKRSNRRDGDRTAFKEIPDRRRGQPVSPGNDDKAVRVRLYDEGMLKPDAGEGGARKCDVHVAFREPEA